MLADGGRRALRSHSRARGHKNVRAYPEVVRFAAHRIPNASPRATTTQRHLCSFFSSLSPTRVSLRKKHRVRRGCRIARNVHVIYAVEVSRTQESAQSSPDCGIHVYMRSSTTSTVTVERTPTLWPFFMEASAINQRNLLLSARGRWRDFLWRPRKATGKSSPSAPYWRPRRPYQGDRVNERLGSPLLLVFHPSWFLMRVRDILPPRRRDEKKTRYSLRVRIRRLLERYCSEPPAYFTRSY